VSEEPVPSAIEAVDYSKLRQEFVRAVARLCPGWLAGQRDDLVQAAVMRVMQSLDRRAVESEEIAPLASSYLYRVAYSALVDEIRRITRRRETDLEDAAVERVAVTADDPERVAGSRELGREIQDCLTRLKRERRLVVALYLQGHSVAEASRVLEWPAKRTENLVYRGLADLRQCLMSKGIRP
jgi:RNA polymerase sigma-70 factor (ECF subfamily)